MIRILAAEVPGAPGTPTKVESTKTYIVIRWTASTYTGGVPIESYNVYARPGSDPYELQTTHTDLSDLSFTIVVPTENIGVTYQFKVTANNEVGEGTESTEKDIIAGHEPGLPTNLLKVTADIDHITFSWQEPADNGGTPVTDYQIMWDNGQGSGMSMLASSTSGPVTQWTTTGTVSAADLLDGVLYRFSVIAVNAIGAGSTSEVIGIYAAEVPDAPEAPTLVSQASNAITISWTDLDVAKNGGSPVLDYKIFWQDPTSNLGFVEIVSSTKPDYQYTFSDLSAGQEYKFTIVATNVIGDSEQSAWAGFFAASLPGMPGKPLKQSSTDDPSITIDWTEPGSNGGSPVLTYNIYVDGVLAGSTPGNTRMYTETVLLTLGDVAVFRVSAVNVIGEGALSLETSIIAAMVPYKPAAPIKKDASASFIEPKWTAPQDGGSPIRGYRVYKNGVKVGETEWNVYDFIITLNL